MPHSDRGPDDVTPSQGLGMEFGHSVSTVRVGDVTARIDAWGTGPFMFRIDGKRVFFEDSDRFGPAVLRVSDWNPSDRQPGEKSRFWDAYGMWRKAGRPLRGAGQVKVAVWKEPQPGRYWKDENGISHFLNDPDLWDGPYLQISKAEADKRFLDKLEAEIEDGAAKDIDPALVARMKALTAGIEVDLDAPIEGDVSI